MSEFQDTTIKQAWVEADITVQTILSTENWICDCCSLFKNTLINFYSCQWMSSLCPHAENIENARWRSSLCGGGGGGVGGPTNYLVTTN